MKKVVPQEVIEQKILLIRGQKVMLDKDLAQLYSVETRVLNQAVQRNIERFPEDFMFQLTEEEFKNLIFHSGISNLKSQNVISSWGGTRKLPYAFTEQGVSMLSSVLHSKQAILVNVAIMRAFVKLREILSTHKELAHKLSQLERKIEKHDGEIKAIFDAIRQLMAPPKKRYRRIGFRMEKNK